MAYCCCEIKKLKTFGQLTAAHSHNFRTADCDFLHIDKDMSHLNHDLISHPPTTITDMVRRRFAEVQAITGTNPRKRKDAVIAYELVLTYSHNKVGEIDEKKWEEENLKWLKEKFGDENIISAMVHMDETTPHIHAIVTPITKDNRLCAKDFTGGKAKMIQLQDSYAGAMSQFSLDRGEKNSQTTRRKLQKFYSIVESAFNETLPKRMNHEAEDDYYERVQEFLTNREIKNRGDVLSLERERDISRTQFWNFKRKYRKAIKLYDKLSDIFSGDEEVLNNEINNLLALEENVPREQLNALFAKVQAQVDNTQSIEKEEVRR